MEESKTPGPQARRSLKPTLRWVFVAIGFVLMALAVAWQWYDGRNQMNALREELAHRVRDSETDSRDARLVARQAQDALREAQAKLAQLELKTSESQNQQAALEALYQDLSRNSDESTLLEIEQILTIASLQLRLSGNVPGALAALKMADARLARSARPQFLPLRKVFARDMERLKVESGPDISDLAAKLDQAIASVDTLVLAQDARPQAPLHGASTPDAQNAWERLVADLLGAFKRLIKVQKVEGDEPALLSPSQSFFLRENLKLRLLSARLSLLARDEATYRNDLKVSQSWLKRYFDIQIGAGAATSEILKRLGAVPSGVSLPSIDESLAAVRGFKAARQRAAR